MLFLLKAPVKEIVHWILAANSAFEITFDKCDYEGPKYSLFRCILFSSYCCRFRSVWIAAKSHSHFSFRVALNASQSISVNEEHQFVVYTSLCGYTQPADGAISNL